MYNFGSIPESGVKLYSFVTHVTTITALSETFKRTSCVCIGYRSSTFLSLTSLYTISVMSGVGSHLRNFDDNENLKPLPPDSDWSVSSPPVPSPPSSTPVSSPPSSGHSNCGFAQKEWISLIFEKNRVRSGLLGHKNFYDMFSKNKSYIHQRKLGDRLSKEIPLSHQNKWVCSDHSSYVCLMKG